MFPLPAIFFLNHGSWPIAVDRCGARFPPVTRRGWTGSMANHEASVGGAKQSWGEDSPKYLVIPAQAKIQWLQSFASKMLGSRVRGNDEQKQGLPRVQGKTPALLPAFF